MDEIICGVQVIKIYAWERPFTHLIAIARRLELKVVLKNAYVRAIYMTFIFFTTRTALFCTVLATLVVYGQESITVAMVFKVAALFNAISHVMSQMFVRGVAEIAEASVAFKRLQNFLDYEEKSDDKLQNQIDSLEMNGTGKEKKIIVHAADNLEYRNVAVSVKNLTANWKTFVKPTKKAKVPKDEKPMLQTGNGGENVNWRPPTLQNINLEIPKGKLIGVVGPVGAGKSSLLQALLRELPLESGSVSINGSLSYACQEPWVFAGTVRQNILFGLEMDRKHYDAAVKSCDLAKDFASFENGDQTMIGERGASLSGGQKARIK